MPALFVCTAREKCQNAPPCWIPRRGLRTAEFNRAPWGRGASLCGFKVFYIVNRPKSLLLRLEDSLNSHTNMDLGRLYAT
jgi:hypothetical protein